MDQAKEIKEAKEIVEEANEEAKVNEQMEYITKSLWSIDAINEKIRTTNIIDKIAESRINMVQILPTIKTAYSHTLADKLRHLTDRYEKTTLQRSNIHLPEGYEIYLMKYYNVLDSGVIKLFLVVMKHIENPKKYDDKFIFTNTPIVHDIYGSKNPRTVAE